MERRNTSITKPSLLPMDYLKMVTEIFSSHFDAELKAISPFIPSPYFETKGIVHSNEIILAVSLVGKEQLSASTIYASSDFDPQAATPTAQEILSTCIDGIATLFGSLLSIEHPEILLQLAEKPLSAIENIPFHWTAMETHQRKIYMKLDKTNLHLDQIAEEWLMSHDPDFIEMEANQEKEVENLFITGSSIKKPQDIN